MPGLSDLRKYQWKAIHHILYNPSVLSATGSGVFVDMGLGKSVITATAAEILIHQWKVFDKVLIIAPKLVAEQTWAAEFKKWDHLRHMTVSLVSGSVKQRTRALQTSANVYCIGRDNITWLVNLFKGYWPFKFVIIDELSSFKHADALRFKSLRSIRPQIEKIVGLTGTPASNGLIDLWAQLFLLDQGTRLGKYVTHYRKQYFNFKTNADNIDYDFKIKKEKDKFLGADLNSQLIADKIGDICISMKSEDYLDLPPIIDIYQDAQWPDALMKEYKAFARDSVMDVNQETITAFSAAGLYNKLLQFANGAVYDAEGNTHVIHDHKLDLLEEIIEEVDGEPVLLFYNFQSDVERIKKRFGKLKPTLIKGAAIVDKWNRGEIKLGMMHPSNGIGVNLQEGGRTLVWFGMPWGLEGYQQSCKRLHRMGQQKRVNNYVLLTPGTLEYKVAQRLYEKEATQNDLMFALKAEVDELQFQAA